MIRKIIVLGVLVIFLFLPVPSFAQKLGGSVNSIDDINTADIPNDSVVVISKEESGVPGIVHEKYAFVDQAWPGGSR
jgi:hypothetical protein